MDKHETWYCSGVGVGVGFGDRGGVKAKRVVTSYSVQITLTTFGQST